MTDQLVETVPHSPAYLSQAWQPFAQKLASVLGGLKEDQCLILSVKRSNRIIQFAVLGSYGIRMETTSNSYLPKPERLDQRRTASLVEAGWSAPTGTPLDSTPEKDPDGSPNFFVEFPAPVSFDAVAQLAVRTFAEILRVPHPGNLEYRAFDTGQDTDIPAPALGLNAAAPSAPADLPANLYQQLLSTLRAATGISELSIDKDGDIGLRCGSALTFVRVIEEPTYIRIYARILRDVEETEGICSRLNDINANISLVRFVFQNGAIFAVADICAVPFNAQQVVQAMGHFGSIADEMDSLLQGEFGGHTAFIETMPSTAKH